MSQHPPSTTEAAIQNHWLMGLWKMSPLAMMWAIGAPLVAGGVLVFQAWMLAKTLDQAIRLSVAPAELWGQMLLIALLIALRAFITWSGEIAASRAAEQIKQQLRQQFFAQLLARGPAWSRQTPAGTLTTAILDQVQALDGFIQRFLPATISAVFLPLAFAIVILPIDWIVTLLFLISAPLIPLFMALIGMRAEVANQKHQQVVSRLSGIFADRIRGLFTLALMGRTQDEVNSIRSASKTLSATTMKVLRIAFLSSAVLELFAALGVAGVAIYIGLSYLGMLGAHFSGYTLQHGLFCLLLAPEVYMPLRNMAASYHDRATAKAAAQGLHQLYEQLPNHNGSTLADLAKSPVIQRHAPSTNGIILQARQFALQTPQGRDILQPTNFTLQLNQPIALMGESGIGKTSLLETLAGLRPYASGQLLHYFAEHEYVLIGQQPFISLGTIRQFLLSVNPQATNQQLWSALEQAQAAGFVSSLAQGLDTVLGTRGHGVSGGQAHRLALARLFLTNPRLIMLDEPTAYLDGQTRDAVIDAILRFAQGRALLVATHDDAMARQIGQVWHIQDQKITQEDKS